MGGPRVVFASAAQTGDSAMQMPGTSHSGPLPPLSDRERSVQARLEGAVGKLAGEIGERNVSRRPVELAAAADYIEAELAAAGKRDVNRQRFPVGELTCHNLEWELEGNDLADEVVVVGAHYDTIPECAGANDNGSGVAALLALADLLAASRPARTVRLVAFANEESPYFGTEAMGSLQYASRCRARSENVTAMLSLETIGFFSDEPGSQHYPPPLDQFYPSEGNFIAFVGNEESAPLVKDVVGAFRRLVPFPSEGAALPATLEGVGWSDHWAFWQQGYQALMVTDTAPFRYPHYHEPTDTPERIDYERTARVVTGLARVLEALAEGGQKEEGGRMKDE